MAGYSIKDTTREERQKIDRKLFERIEGKKTCLENRFLRWQLTVHGKLR